MLLKPNRLAFALTLALATLPAGQVLAQDTADSPEADKSEAAQLGTITRKWSYVNRRMDAPEGDVAVTLTAPSGEVWTWGEDDENRVSGPALDFCLVVTQRRHVDDTSLVVEGERARDWLLRAQAFAGPATDGPSPRGN